MIRPIVHITHKRILISPLNWGLGHLMRTVPLINQLIDQHNTVVICCDEVQQTYYKEALGSTSSEQLLFEHHEGYPFNFSGKGRWVVDLAKQFLHLYRFKKQETKAVNEWVEKHNIDLVISDQRYGFYASEVESVIFSHQLTLPLSPLYSAFQRYNTYLMRKFSSCWVFDDEQCTLSGKMGKNKALKKEYLGHFSRFKSTESYQENFAYDFIVVVSGPSNYAAQFFQNVYSIFKTSSYKVVFCVPSSVLDLQSIQNENENITITHPTSKELEHYLLNCKTVISRSGYTTLMDLSCIDKTAILIPTKGQSEQLYLASLHKNHPKWSFIKENQLRKLSAEELHHLAVNKKNRKS